MENLISELIESLVVAPAASFGLHELSIEYKGEILHTFTRDSHAIDAYYFPDNNIGEHSFYQSHEEVCEFFVNQILEANEITL